MSDEKISLKKTSDIEEKTLTILKETKSQSLIGYFILRAFIEKTRVFLSESLWIQLARPANERKNKKESQNCLRTFFVGALSEKDFQWLGENDLVFCGTDEIVRWSALLPAGIALKETDVSDLEKATSVLVSARESLSAPNEKPVRKPIEKPIEISFEISLFDFEKPSRPGLFLDRDGVVIELIQFIKDPDQVKLKESVLPVILEANKNGFPVCVVTNQSGIGRGLYTWQDFDRVNHQMKYLLSQKGAWIDDIDCSPFYGSGENLSSHLFEEKRKPSPRMILSLARKHRVDLSKSAMMGDRSLDLIAGAKAGIPSLWLVPSDETVESEIPADLKYGHWLNLRAHEKVVLSELFS